MRVRNNVSLGLWGRLKQITSPPHTPNQSIKIDSNGPIGPLRMTTETHFTVSDIGSEVLIRRIYSEKNINLRLRPIVLVHGVACNGNIFRTPIDGIGSPYDLQTHSMANYLAENGFDVYVAHLSTSKRVVRRFSSKHEASRHYKEEQYQFPPLIDFDKLLFNELPALIKKVLAIHKYSEDLFYLGHSMGGMLAYAYLGTCGSDKIKAAVTIGSPIRFDQITIKALDAIDKLAQLAGLGDKKNPVARAADNLVPLGIFLSHTHHIPVVRKLANYGYAVQNVEKETAETYFRKSAEPFPPQLREQFLKWSITKGFTSFGGNINYADSMRGIKVPFLLLGGRRDHLARNVSEAASKIRGAEYREADAGHGDLIFGRNASFQVWGPIVDWLFLQNEL